jgi:hypothetical protein
VASRRLPPCVGHAEHSPMVVPHLPVIRAAAPPGILTPPLPTAAPGPHSAPRTGTQSPSPRSAPAPPHSYPGTGPPVPDQSPSLHFCPGGLGQSTPLPTAAPGPSPQSPSPHSAPGTRPAPRPTAAPGPSPLSHEDPSPTFLSEAKFLGTHKSSRQHHGQGWQERSAPVPSSFVRSRARASQCRVLSPGPLLLG